jgi:(1->4)-alpha-D-glucan 1-alpha-D-glucosylmutase
VYRTYVGGEEISDTDRRYILRAVRRAMTRNPAQSAALFEFLRDMLLLLPFQNESATADYRAEQRRFVGKFQQVTGPVMAKAVEDTSFYIFNRLLSLNDVGGNPDQFGLPPPALHRFLHERQANWPWAMSATSTHDTKRSEDVRARLNVLSEMPTEWAECVARWSQLNATHRIVVEEQEVPDRNEEWFLYQTLVGAWPLEALQPEQRDHAVKRLQAYMLKALHEAKVHTSWINPNAAYDDAMRLFVERILHPETGRLFVDEMRSFQRRLSHLWMINSLAQTLVKITAPGVPDIYQGTELWDYSLVDPDNRRPVDYDRRRDMLRGLKDAVVASGADRRPLARDLFEHRVDGRIKLYVTWQALHARRQLPELYTTGAYLPVETRGPQADHVFAFVRRHESAAALIVVPRLLSRLVAPGEPAPWDGAILHDTVLPIPDDLAGRPWRNIFTGEMLVARDRHLPAEQALEAFPVGLFWAE